MKFADYYRKFIADCDRMGADHFDDDNGELAQISSPQLIGALVSGDAGVGDVGDELARRGLLDQVPGDHWGDGLPGDAGRAEAKRRFGGAA